MLSKLLKYDLKWIYKPLVIFYILGIIFSCIIRIVEKFKATLILLIIDKICCGIVISIIISIMINCLMRTWARFVKNIYKDESYLTHTLPVSKNKIYLSKVLGGIITLLTSFIVIIICLAISTLNKDTWLILKDSLENSAVYFNSSVLSLIFVMVTAIFFEVLFMMLSGILGIIIGYKSNNHKLVKSVLFGFIIYMSLSFLSVVILYLIGLISPDLMNIFNSTLVNSNALKSMLIIGIGLYVIYNFIIYFTGNKLLNKGVDVD